MPKHHRSARLSQKRFHGFVQDSGLSIVPFPPSNQQRPSCLKSDMIVPLPRPTPFSSKLYSQGRVRDAPSSMDELEVERTTGREEMVVKFRFELNPARLFSCSSLLPRTSPSHQSEVSNGATILPYIISLFPTTSHISSDDLPLKDPPIPETPPSLFKGVYW